MRCLIQITVALMLVGATAASAQTTRWSFKTIVDPITDARRGIAAIESQEVMTRGMSASEALNTAGSNIHSNARYMLVVKCDFEARGVYVSLASPRGMSRGESSVTQRFDAGIPTTKIWSNSGTSVSLFSPDDVLTFVAGAMQATRIALRIRDADGGGPADTVTFTGAGAARAISQVYQACGQSLP